MQITVKLFARFREAAGTSQLALELPEETTLNDLLTELQTRFNGLTLTPERTILSINQDFATANTKLKPGDEVAIFPPVSGGSNANPPAAVTSADGKFSITYHPIVLDDIARQVTHAHTGAVATFTGVVRNVSGEKDVSHLEYEAYAEMALAKLQQVAQEAYAQWPDIVDVAIVQRIGHLKVGEVAVAVAVSSPHRYQGCFQACEYGINRLKEIVPIWKKETGPDGASWVEGDYNPSL